MQVRITSLALVLLVLIPVVSAGSQFRISLSQKAIDDFELVDQDGEKYDSTLIDADVIVASFVFTTCPDVCPTLTQTLKIVQNSLDEDVAKKVEFISISVDPENDTPEKMKAYADHHGVDWPHLTGSKEELKEIWNDIGIGVETIVADDGMSDEHNGMENHSLTHQVITVLPDGNSSIFHAASNDLPTEANAWNLTTTTYEDNDISLNYTSESGGHMVKGISGHDSPSDWSWWWELRVWNTTGNSWESSDVGVDNVNLSEYQHIAWAPNYTALNETPLPECSGNGWIMGEGDMAHCMCDDGYTWSEGDMSSCIASKEVVIHNPYTFILDSKLKPRFKFSTDQWKAEDMVDDINDLLDAEESGGMPGFTTALFLSALILAIAYRKE